MEKMDILKKFFRFIFVKRENLEKGLRTYYYRKIMKGMGKNPCTLVAGIPAQFKKELKK